VVRRSHTFALVLTAAAVAAVLAGCSSSTPTTSGASTTGAASNGASTTPPPAKAALPKGGKCVLLTTDQAAALLGSTPKSSASAVSGGKIVHIDGCTYIGAGSNLGYDINEYTSAGTDPKTVVLLAQTAMAKAPGTQKFDVPGGDASLAFTMAVGGKTMARIEIAVGKYAVSVNGIASDPAKAKQIALGAAAILVAAVS